jgi:hypothetical protein
MQELDLTKFNHFKKSGSFGPAHFPAVLAIAAELQ